MYEGEVFTFKSDRPTRPSVPRTASRQPAPSQELRQAEALATGERMARLEATVVRLEENLAHLTGVVQLLTDRLEDDEPTVRPHTMPEAAAVHRPAAPTSVTVQMMPLEPPAPTTSSDVKVSLFPGSGSEAILGQVRIIQNS